MTWRVRVPGQIGVSIANEEEHWVNGFTSRIMTAAPSPITKPARSLSKGREDLAGSSLYLVTRLRDLANPPMASGCMQDSAPPATITSASPCCMNRIASPMEWAPVVHAVVAVWFGP